MSLFAGVVAFFIGVMSRNTPAEDFKELLAGADIEKPNIVFITLDTTRADRLGCYGSKNVKTPHMDSMAENGVLFETCISSSPLTLPSHCSMMTGQYPTFHGVRVNGNTALSKQHHTLAELLAGDGYQCGAFIAAFVLDGRWGLNQGFHHYDDHFDLKKYKKLDLGGVQRPGNEIVDAAVKWLDTQKEKPFFAWIHLYDPHTPYEPPEPYRSQYNNGKMSGLYDGEVAYTDEHVGRVLDWLKQNNLDENTIVVVMGDHGEGLGDHGEATHGFYIYDYAVHVPFLIKTPFNDLKGHKVNGPVRTIDIYPTLLDMAGIEVPKENQGKSLLPFMFDEELPTGIYAYSESMTPNLQYGWSPLHSLRGEQYKFIEAPRPELYDLTRDPKELSNLANRRSVIVKNMSTRLTKIMKDSSEGAPEPEAADLDSDTLKRLATLGYIGSPVKRKRGKSLADPKDKLEIFEKVSLAAEHINRDKYPEAAKELEEVLKEDPKVIQARLLLSTCYNKLDRRPEAIEHLDIILKENPDNVQALISMANLLMEEGKSEDVITLCKKAIAVDNRNTQAYTLMGEVYMEVNDHENALPNIKKSVEIQPKLTQNRQNLAACYIGLKQYGEAETILKDILEETPKFPFAHFHLGLLNEEQGQYDDALTAYEKEVEHYPKAVPARFNRAKILIGKGDLQGYLEQMRKVVELEPEMAKGHLFLARGLLRQWDTLDEPGKESVLAMVQKGVELTKESRLKALGYFLMADYFNRQQQPAKVREALEKANYFKEKN